MSTRFKSPVLLLFAFAIGAGFFFSAGLTPKSAFADAPTFTETQDPDPIFLGDSASLHLVIGGVSGPSTKGCVDIFTNGTQTGSCVSVINGLVNVTGDWAFSTATAGTSTLRFHFQGNVQDGQNYDPADSPTYSITVLPLPAGTAVSTTTVSSSPNPSTFGQSNTFTAQVTGGSGTPTGTVSFIIDHANRGSATLDGSGVATFSTASFGLLDHGSHTVSATYLGNGQYAHSSGAGPNQVVTAADSSISIGAHGHQPSVTGEEIPVSAFLCLNGGLPCIATGNVIVSDGVVSCSVPAATVIFCVLPTATAGTKTLTATYAGDGNVNGSTSAGVTHLVVAADTTTTITAHTPDPSVTGQPVSISFTVAPVAPGAVVAPTTIGGTVTIKDDQLNTICTALVSIGTCSGGIPAAGSRTLTATYSGDANFNGSTSTGVPQTVNTAATTPTITIPTVPATSVTGQPYNVSWTVAANPPGAVVAPTTPTGTVSLSDGLSTCSGTAASGSCSLTSITAGTKTLTATYTGDSNFASSTGTASHTVNAASTATTINNHTPAPSVTGQPITVTFSVAVVAPGAIVAPTSIGAALVTVKDDQSNVICSGAVTAGTCTGPAPAAGARTLTATYAGDANFATSTSAGVSHTVNKADTTTTINSHLANPSVSGQAVTVTYTVAPVAPGAVVSPTTIGTGVVTVKDDQNNTICTGTVTAGTCSGAIPAAGARTLIATYAGDVNFNGSASPGAAHTVNKATTTTVLSSTSPSSTLTGQAYTVSWNVVVNAPGAVASPTALTGTVVVSDGTSTCSAPVASGSCLLTSLTPGLKTVTASYPGDADFLSSSGSTTHQASKASTVTTITNHAPSPSTVNQPYVVTWSVAVQAPGSGTPTGTVTVTDGIYSCTATLPVTSCTLTPTIAGVRTLVATYSGDLSFAGSVSAGVSHTVWTPAQSAANLVTVINTSAAASSYKTILTNQLASAQSYLAQNTVYSKQAACSTLNSFKTLATQYSTTPSTGITPAMALAWNAQIDVIKAGIPC